LALVAHDFMQLWNRSKRRHVVLFFFFDCVGVARLLRIRNGVGDTLTCWLDALIHKAILIYDLNLLLELDVLVHLGYLMLFQIF